MTPYEFNAGGATVFINYSNGEFQWDGIHSTNYIRPVINLKADVTISGSGTTTDPYVVN